MGTSYRSAGDEVMETRVVDAFLPVYCMKLRHRFSTISSTRIDIKSFTKDLSALMGCPPVSNITMKELHRFNMPPVNDSDVGLKTDLLTVNPTQLIRFGNIKVNPDPLVQRLSLYGNSSIIVPAFAFSPYTNVAITTLKVLRPIRPHQRVVFFSPSYLKNLAGLWKGRGLNVFRLSTGFMLINVALELCDHVHVYGFWPFGINLQQQDVQHHYFDNVGPNLGFHSMPKEFLNLLQFHSQGALTLHLQPCS
ncbi:Alpha-2,8-sialyltransferase 8F [Triplophysa tibetana]|uniref:Alpha-2,8-sialyltransferase 8F n=1 Tax=Triplophysa tibetana TaxID=1572043 RepID=A0A5A9NAF8_9TELE|nr:Alpha-2,8-sialyltransferase 8F [Triplophysa tibetana]